MSLFKKNQKGELLSYPCSYYFVPPLKGDNRQKKLSLFFLIIIIIGFCLIFLVEKPQEKPQVKYSPDTITLAFIEDFVKGGKEIGWSLFLLAWNEVQKNFIYFDKVDIKEMNNAIVGRIERFIYDAYGDKIDEKEINIAVIETMINELDCPFSRFKIAPYPQMLIREIGITIQKRKEIIEIINVENESPAENKIMIGDKLRYVNNVTVNNLTLSEVAGKLKGEAGTEVKLSISRAGYDYLKIFKIIRREIRELPPIPVPPTVEWKLKDNNIAYIKIFQFTDNLYFDFHRVVNEILESPADKIILDLRNNPGGDLEIVKKISEHFLRENEIILIENKREKIVKYRSQQTGKLLEKEIVILVNSGSASGAEIMAATLRDNRGAILIGEKTFGKASVQRIFHLKERYSIILTTNTWLTPKEKSIDGVGITPDYEIIDTNQQLDVSIELLN